MAARRGKWQPPPPSPRILHLPRRTRRSRTAKPPAVKPSPARSPTESGRNLEALFDQERSFSHALLLDSSGDLERRARVEATSSGEKLEDSGEERWRFQAEILRAECNFLRMEREVALRKLETNRSQMEATLSSAVETLVSGRKKVDGSESVELEEKLGELQGRRRRSGLVLQRSCGRNFDRQASVLRRRLAKMPEETSVREIREIAVSNLPEETPLISDRHCRFPDVEILRRKMEGVSKGMLERVVEYGSFLSPATSSTSGNNYNNRFLEIAKQHHHQERGWVSGRCKCKEVVGRIVEQVRAEMEQWSEMQGMLVQVKEEMEELQSSRDLWQRRAHASELNLRSLHAHMLEWKRRAQASEDKVTELQKHISDLQIELQTLRHINPLTSSSTTHSNICKATPPRIKGFQQRSLDTHKEKEKHVLICRLKDNSKSSFHKRSPLQDIGNLSPLFRA